MGRRPDREADARGWFPCAECGAPGSAVVLGAPCDRCVRRSTPWTYLAVTPCGTVAKIGRAKWPLSRVGNNGYDIRRAERAMGVGRVALFRVYPGDVEQACHRFMAPERLTVGSYREWYRVGPRFNVLVSRLDRQFSARSRASLHNQNPAQAA